MNFFTYIKRFFEKFSRSSKWFIRMWNNYDWDHDFLIEMMVYKMKDIRDQFDFKDISFVDLRHQPDRFHAPNDKEYNMIDTLTGLDKAIDIGDKILKHDYIHYSPELQEWFDTHEFFNCLKDMPEELHKQFRECHKKADKEEQNDRNEFFNVIRDNHLMWWS